MIANAPAAFPILAIDLGQYKSVACWFQPASGEVRFQTVTTSASDLSRLLDGQRPTVVIEACALTGWVSDLCGQLGLECRVANTPLSPGNSSTPSARPTATTPSAWPSSPR